MKKTLLTTSMLIALGAGGALAPASAVYAQEASVNTEISQKNWLDAANTRIDLAQAKAALLRARIALEIENSPERARLALDESLAWISQAKETAESGSKEQMQTLAEEVGGARDAIAEMPGETGTKIDALIVATETRLLAYKQAALETDEAKLLQLRYTQAEAHAVLLQAQLAEKMDETGELATAYLDKARVLYQSTKEGASDSWHASLEKISADIDAANHLIAEKRDQAGTAISDISERAARFVRGAQEN